MDRIFCWGYLVCHIFASAYGGMITSFEIDAHTLAHQGKEITITCNLSDMTSPVYIYKSPTMEHGSDNLIACYSNVCLNAKPALYGSSISDLSLTITVKSLNRSVDERWWTCKSSVGTTPQMAQFYLTVYSMPSSITLDGTSDACDLGTSNCQFTCKTNGCTYPAPVFSWFYSNNNGELEAEFPNLGHVLTNNQVNVCTSSAKFFQETLTLARYTGFSGNIPMTIQLKCKMLFSQLPSATRISDFSRDVVFAVKVSTVNITDDGNNLPEGELIVSENESKTLICIPGNGHPDSTVTWYIGNSVRTTGRIYNFEPSNSLHGQQIYCTADNIPSNDIHDAVSTKHILYVTVKTQYVYIQPAEEILSVIENIPEPVVCVTSPGRPRSTISWFKQYNFIGKGNETYFESRANKLEVTKSTRYFRISRADNGWKLSCSASNVEGSGGIEANNSKSFNVLYTPEHMSFSYAGKLVVGPVVDIINGTPGTLKCSASSNPPASLFSWNINQIVGDTLTIDNKIHNNQVVNCTAQNIMTSAAGITIKGYGSIVKTINVQYGAIIERIEVNGKATTSEIKENDPVQIACYVDSNPSSTISLFQGTDRLTETKRSVTLFYNISSAQCSHTSQYTCRADNGIANVEQPAVKNVQVNVECSPRLAYETESSIFAKENTTAVLSLMVLAYPNPTLYNWYKISSNGWKELINTPSTQMIHASLQMILAQFNLILINVKPEDYGEYKLTVSNSIGAPFNFTFVLQRHAAPAKTSEDNKVDRSTLSAVAGSMGTVLVVVIVIVVILVLIIWRNYISVRKEDNMTYEMPNRAAQGSGDRTYDTVNPNTNEYENAGP